ncbi:ParB N-terminal domain-containing protein [Streptomyces sp. NBC_01716]|uniref:ParB N-terminal domain-containing protein n=1 Tax=Streptomyces sp. NBC_01716 TaxID=2975917 RepID=UPI002E2FF9C0|nr:ParB N-terminal domain-containing protein [Streptomyces sp. NBC_01716]
MSPWVGSMPTSHLNDRQIRPIQFRKWADAHRQFARGKDRKTVDAYKALISKEGLREPILIGVSDRDEALYVGDGHHRAVALMELGANEFPFHWYWIRSFGVRVEREPFPKHLLR